MPLVHELAKFSRSLSSAAVTTRGLVVRAVLILGMAGCSMHDSAYYGDGDYGHVRVYSGGGYASPAAAYSLWPDSIYRRRYYGPHGHLVPYYGPHDYWPAGRMPYPAPPPGYGLPHGYFHVPPSAPAPARWLNRKPPPSVPIPPSGSSRQLLDQPFQPPAHQHEPSRWLQPLPPRHNGSALSPLSCARDCNSTFLS